MQLNLISENDLIIAKKRRNINNIKGSYRLKCSYLPLFDSFFDLLKQVFDFFNKNYNFFFNAPIPS